MAVLAAVAAFVLAADVITKAIVVAHLRPEQPVHLLGNVFDLWLTRNSGAAFSVGTGQTIVFTVIAFGVAVTLSNNWMSFAFHNYQGELFPTRVRARAVGFVYSWSRDSATSPK